MANIFDDLFGDINKQAEAGRQKRFNAKFGKVKPKVTNIQTKLGKEDYETLKDAIKRDVGGYNAKAYIRLSIKLGMPKFARMLFDDYYE